MAPHVASLERTPIDEQTGSRSVEVRLDLYFPHVARNAHHKELPWHPSLRPAGVYRSWKSGRPIFWESRHELNAYRVLDASPDVVEFRERPVTIRLTIDGREYLHRPHVLVEREKSCELWEIKSTAEASERAFVSRVRLLAAALAEKGFDYRVIAAENLGAEPRLSNVIQMLTYGCEPVEADAGDRVRDLYAQAARLTWGQVMDGQLGPQAHALVARLVLEGFLSFDMDCPLGAHTTFNWEVPA